MGHEFTKGDFQPPFCLRVLEPSSRIYPLLRSSHLGVIVVPSLRHFGIFDCSQPELESTSGSFLATKRGLRFLLHPDFELPPRWQQDPLDTCDIFSLPSLGPLSSTSYLLLPLNDYLLQMRYLIVLGKVGIMFQLKPEFRKVLLRLPPLQLE